MLHIIAYSFPTSLEGGTTIGCLHGRSAPRAPFVRTWFFILRISPQRKRSWDGSWLEGRDLSRPWGTSGKRRGWVLDCLMYGAVQGDGMWYLIQGQGLKAYFLCLLLFLQLNCFRWKTTSWLPNTFLCSAKKTLTGSSKCTGKTLKCLATHGPDRDQTVIKWKINWLNWNLWQQWFYDTQYTFDVNLRLT